MHSLIDAAVDRWRTVLLILAFIFISGLVAYDNVPKEAAPDVKIPLIYVSMTLDGISPEDGERLLVRPMEKQLKSIESVKKMTAQSVESLSSVTLEFEAGFNSDKALDDVRAAVDLAKPDLPVDADEPKVVELSFSKFPILNVLLTGDVDHRTLVRVGRDLRDKLEGISSVLEAQLVGDREEVLEIVINPLVLESYNISPNDVFERVRNNNILIPAGEQDTGSGSFALKLPGLIEELPDLRSIPLKVDGDAVTTLSDIAEIRRGFKDVQTYARVNGKPAVALQVSKRVGANIIDTVDQVRKLVEEERAYWPNGLEVVFSADESDKIRERLVDLQNNLIIAVLLVMVVILWVMGFRSAGLVAFAVPGAFLFGVLCLSLFGFTMNVVVLFALILSIGMLVDSAIVVCEYADRLMMDGVPMREAYPQAAKRMGWPIIASTLTTLVVFMPLLFWPGLVGQFMKYMPITLILTLTGSLLMALVFVPTLGARLGKQAKIDPEEAKRVVAAETGDLNELGGFTLGYAKLLNRILLRPLTSALAVFVLAIFLFISYGMFGAGVEFFPKIEPDNAQVDIKARGNLSVDERDRLVHQVEERIEPMMKEISTRYTQAGKISLRFETPEDIIGRINVEFSDWRDRRTADEILSEMRALVQGVPGVQVETNKKQEGPPVGKAVQVEFTSRFPEALDKAVLEFRRGLDAVGGFINITDDRPIPSIEWELVVNRELAGRYDISVSDIGQLVKMTSNGIIINTYRPDDADDEIDIITRFPEQYRNLTQLDQLRVYTPNGLVPIGNYVERKPKQRVSTIRRLDGARMMAVRADVEPGLNADAKLKELLSWVEENADIPPVVNAKFGGEDEEQKEAGKFLSIAFLIALFSMALILVTQFNSIYYMIVIMSAVFLSSAGVMLGLLVTGEAFGIVMCGVGIISLAGIVVNNNIIFIDTYQILKKQGMEVNEALVRTGAQRLRPILLTAGTTVLGLLPMVLEMNINFVSREITFGAPSAQWWVQLSTAIAGGLTFATILTLFLTPCLLMLEARTPLWMRGKADKLRNLRHSVSARIKRES